jgi:L-asparaginase II
MAKLVTPERLDGGRRTAATRLIEAVSAHPWQVAGSGRFDTRAMSPADGAFVVKTGAEGVHVAGLRRLGLGVAVKIDDGARRGAELAMAAVLRLIGVLNPNDAQELERAVVLSRRGVPVGIAAPSKDWLTDAETEIVLLCRS